MTITARLLSISALLTLVVPAIAEYASLGVTRAQVQAMLTQEGLNPTPNKYPDQEGDPVNELLLSSPFISIMMFGPDSGLNSIEFSTRPSTNENDAYWQGYISLWILNAIFPEWDNREEWLTRTMQSMARGTADDSLSFERNGHTVKAAMSNGYFFLAITGREIE